MRQPIESGGGELFSDFSQDDEQLKKKFTAEETKSAVLQVSALLCLCHCLHRKSRIEELLGAVGESVDLDVRPNLRVITCFTKGAKSSNWVLRVDPRIFKTLME